MRTARLWGEEVNLTGFYIFGILTLVKTVLKVTAFEHWTWWRVLLPVGIFVGFNMAYICVGFVYLTLARLTERAEQKGASVDETPHLIPYYWISMLFFAVFADNAVRWLEGNDTAYWFWLFSGEGETVAIFGALSVLNLFLYWFRVGRALTEPD